MIKIVYQFNHNLFWSEIIPPFLVYLPSPTPPSEDPDVKTSTSGMLYTMICYVFCGRVKLYSSPHLWLEQVLSLALQIKKVRNKIYIGQFSN